MFYCAVKIDFLFIQESFFLSDAFGHVKIKIRSVTLNVWLNFRSCSFIRSLQDLEAPSLLGSISTNTLVRSVILSIFLTIERLIQREIVLCYTNE